MGRARPAVAAHVTRDDPDECTAVGRGQQQDLARLDPLVARIEPLVGRREVHPELDPVEQAAGGDELLGRALDVQDARPGGHPLGGAVGDEAAAADGVLVLEGAVDHVGHRLEATVGVPGRALRLTGGVLDLAHLVHVDERVEVGQRHTREGAPYGEALALETRGRVGDALDRADGGGLGGHADPREQQGCLGRSLQARRTSLSVAIWRLSGERAPPDDALQPAALPFCSTGPRRPRPGQEASRRAT